MGYFDGRDGALPTEERRGNSSRATTCTTSAEQLISGDNARIREPSRTALLRAVQKSRGEFGVTGNGTTHRGAVRPVSAPVRPTHTRVKPD